MIVMIMAPAIVLLSGGLDSTTCLAIAQAEGFTVSALSFRYGQRHAFELERAVDIAQHAGVSDHRVVNVDLRAFGGSALTGDIAVPKHDRVEDVEADIPVTYVPARNTIFLSFAVAMAEVLESSDIFIGVNALDYSGYPDCRPEFIAAFQSTAQLATRRGVDTGKLTIHAPLMELTKAEIIRRGLELGVEYGRTSSCYDPTAEGRACGRCDSCLLRLKGFAEAGATDPIRYVDAS